MTIETLTIGDPFFTVRVLRDETAYVVDGKTIFLNLSDKPVSVREQKLGQFQSVVLNETVAESITHAVVIEGYADHENDDELMAQIRETWPTAFDVRGEERLRGIGHYMSPKVWLGQFGFTIYHSATVPLNVGLHKDHAFCPVPGFREVHTQIVGFGVMQQCRERDVNTLYLEEPMSPGTTHRPMFDEQGNFPWHQFETITPSVIMAVEMLPEGATPPQL